jgi:hypothetical protein
VKKAQLPVRLAKREMARMRPDAERFGWKWLVAALLPTGEVALLDPDRARKGREIRLGDEAVVDNVLAWI